MGPVTEDSMRTRRAVVHHDAAGRILAIMIHDASPGAPPTSMSLAHEAESSEVELSGDLATVPLLHLHAHYQVDRSSGAPRLVPRPV